MDDWTKLPLIRNDALLFQDTSFNPLPGAIAPCLLCMKPFLVRRYTGELDQICGECWEDYKDCARIVCARCKATVCRAVPKVLDNGYYIRPKSVLHIDKCNTCQPGLKQSTIMEIDTWMRTQRRGKPTIIVPASAQLIGHKTLDGVQVIKDSIG